MLYDSTCDSPFYRGVSSGETVVGAGRVPSTSSVGPGSVIQGTADAYRVDGFELAYCTIGSPVVDLEVGFYDSYSICSDATQQTPTARILLPGVPGDTTGSGSCWIVAIDLAGSGQDFTLRADGDGAWDPAGCCATSSGTATPCGTGFNTTGALSQVWSP